MSLREARRDPTKLKEQLCPLWLDVRRRYPDLDLVCNLLPWLIRHAAWLIARFHTRSKDQMTPYRLVTGSDYSHPLATLGEVVLVKLPTTKSKAQRRWVKGLWLGKLDRDDSHILGTSSGAIAVRSVRRLPLESQTDGVMMKAMKGIPWQPRDGVRHRITRDISHFDHLLPELDALSFLRPRELPHLARSCPLPAVRQLVRRVDIDGLTVEAAAQLEEVVRPDEEDELPAGSPAEEGQSSQRRPHHNLHRFVERLVVTNASVTRRTYESIRTWFRREAGSTASSGGRC